MDKMKIEASCYNDYEHHTLLILDDICSDTLKQIQVAQELVEKHGFHSIEISHIMGEFVDPDDHDDVYNSDVFIIKCFGGSIYYREYNKYDGTDFIEADITEYVMDKLKEM